MRYNQVFRASGNNGIEVYNWEFRANSIYDPDFDGTGHYPYGYNQVKDLFEKYTVTGSKITLTVINANVADNGPLFVVLMAEDEDGELEAALTDISGHIDHPIYERKDMIVRQVWTLNDCAPRSNWTAHIKKYRSTKSIFNVRDLDDEGYTAAMNANPGIPWYWGIGFYCPGIASDSHIDIWMIVNITYYVTLSEPVGAAISGPV